MLSFTGFYIIWYRWYILGPPLSVCLLISTHIFIFTYLCKNTHKKTAHIGIFCLLLQLLYAACILCIWCYHGSKCYYGSRHSIDVCYCVNLLTTNVTRHLETSKLIFNANQLTSFCIMGTLVANGLILKEWLNY